MSDAGVRWTSPSGRSWHSPTPYDPPAAPVRPLPPLSCPADALEQLTPGELENELRLLDPASPFWDDSAGAELHAPDLDLDEEPVVDHDRLARRLRSGDTRWSLDLADPYAWWERALPLSV